MALRFMRYDDASVLRKKAIPIKEITAGTLRLLDDMIETMRHHHGVGLAAPQIGISKQVVVIEWGEQLFQIINPEIIEAEGEIITEEGCLSFPGVWGEVQRFSKITVKALNRDGEEIIILAEDRLAVIFQHEIDHLKGEVFVDKVIRFTNEEDSEEDSEEEEQTPLGEKA